MRLERPGLKPERLDLRPERPDLRLERLDLRPERLKKLRKGETYGRVLQDIGPLLWGKTYL